MATELGISLGALALLVGFPLLLLGMIGLLGWLEAWMLQPDERAAAITELLERGYDVGEVEVAVARLLADAADRPETRPPEPPQPPEPPGPPVAQSAR